MVSVHFCWHDPAGGKKYTLVSISKGLDIVPKVGEEIELIVSDLSLVGDFRVENVLHSLGVQNDPKGVTIEVLQEIIISVQPTNSSTWDAVEKIKAQQDLLTEQKAWEESKQQRKGKSTRRDD